MALSCAAPRVWVPLCASRNRSPSPLWRPETRTRRWGASMETRRQVCCAIGSQSQAVLEEGLLEKSDSASGLTDRVVILFKHDLRVDDHPGLVEAQAMGRQVLPVYCLDPELLQPLLRTPDSVELLWYALHSLKSALQGLNSDLAIRLGPFATALKSFMEETESTVILTEAEVDVKWRAALDTFKQASPEITVQEWTCPLRESGTYSLNFREMNPDAALLPPLAVPEKLPPSVEELDSGELPELEAFKQLLLEKHESVFKNGHNPVDPFLRSPGEGWSVWSRAVAEDSLKWLDTYLSQSSQNENSALLRDLMQLTEDSSFPGISFSALFSLPLSLGILSPRRVHCEVQKRVFSPLWSPIMRAAQRNSQSYDFHSYLANHILQNGCSGAPGASTMNFWRWGGILTEYSVATPTDGIFKGAAVMVHGFGASCMHWRRNVDALTEAGYTVYCPSLPGYGRTQKLYMKYHQALWTQFLTDFITDIVQAPVVLAGNSIGAFVAAQTAAKHPDIVSGLVLINPAGRLIEDYTPSESSESLMKWKPPAFVVDAFSHALLFYLEKSAGRILKSVYPVQEENADEAFLEEILRASYDPNAIAVVKSTFFLQKPEPLNYLLTEKYTGDVLLLQGALDPLNDAVKKAERLKALCPKLQIQITHAGHCSHDEIPEEVNTHLIDFMNRNAV